MTLFLLISKPAAVFLNNNLRPVMDWMSMTILKLNPDKVEFLMVDNCLSGEVV